LRLGSGGLDSVASEGGSSDAGRELVTGIRVGDVLAGKYRVDRVLGEGGMGVVVAAHHLHLDSRVAIKLLRAEMLTSPEAVARFTREARAAVRITSERVARVLDVGLLEGGAPYIVMEFLEGSDLAEIVTRRGPLGIDEAVEFILQACEAIAEAHSLGIVHRDLKPANLFCIRRTDGTLCIKVLDFGISKVTGTGSTPEMAMTKTTSLMGSPYYMSPEQMQSSRTVDVRTDIWAIGVILYELLTRRVPFSGETLPEVCVKIATAPVLPLRSLRPEAPAGLEAIIARCLEKEKERRFASIGELALAFSEFANPRAKLSIESISRTLGGLGLSQSTLSMRPHTAVEAVATISPFGRTAPGVPNTQGKKVAFIAIGGAFLAVAVLLALALRRPGPAVQPAPATATNPVAGPPPAAVTVVPAAAPVPLPAETIPPLPAEAIAAPPAATAAMTATATTKKATSGATPTSAKAKPSCDPNYYLDAQGEKHFKLECFK
jgi:serine/threonine protein kinase